MLSRSALRATRPLRLPKNNAFHTSRPVRASGANAGEGAGADLKDGAEILKKGARRDPELYVLFALVTGALGVAGWHFSRAPTSSTSESPTGRIAGSEPWNTGTSGKYQFHPGGDTSKPRRDAPSALNHVIVPSVTLPKSLHDQFNKYGNDDYD